MPRPTPATPAKRGGGGGAANPFQKLAENHASRAGSVSPSQRTPKSSPRPEPRDPHDAFLLPRTLEGTHHRKLRVLLQEFLKEATAWEEEHTLDGIRWASEMAQAWDDVATATLAIPGTDALAGEQRRARLVPVLMQLEEASAQLAKMCTRLVRSIRTHSSASMPTRWSCSPSKVARCTLRLPQEVALKPSHMSPCGAHGPWTDLVRDCPCLPQYAHLRVSLCNTVCLRFT